MVKPSKYTIEEFYVIRDNSVNPLEYIYNEIYTSPTPSAAHQCILERLKLQLVDLLKETSYEVYSYPYDLQLKRSGEISIITPDLAVVCGKSSISKYDKVPDIIIEIINPINQSHDLVLKLDFYLKYEVKEYWIVNPMLKAVLQFSLVEGKGYKQTNVAKSEGVIQSVLIPDFKIELTKLFAIN